MTLFSGHVSFPILDRDAILGDVVQQARDGFVEMVRAHGFEPTGGMSHKVEHGNPSRITVYGSASPIPGAIPRFWLIGDPE